MKYITKQKRLCAITDAYLKRTGKTAFQIKEVAEFAMSSGLWPVPTRSASEEQGEAWERKLEAAEKTV